MPAVPIQPIVGGDLGHRTHSVSEGWTNIVRRGPSSAVISRAREVIWLCFCGRPVRRVAAGHCQVGMECPDGSSLSASGLCRRPGEDFVGRCAAAGSCCPPARRLRIPRRRHRENRTSSEDVTSAPMLGPDEVEPMTCSIADAGVATEIAAVDQPGSPLRAADPATIGDFRVLRLLGEGGMGTVYLGESSTGRLVAIKVIRPEYSTETEFRERFRRETTHARQVAGFCTAEVLDASPDAEFPYLVTEFVPGPTLSKAVAAGGPLSPADLERLGIGVASALTAIHAAGIAHHDLTPSNVLLHPAGPRVIDFGIANALGTIASVDDDAAWIGTPGYMAPEQAHSDQIGAAADVFAWAGVMAFAATGRPPFGDGAPDVLLHRTLHEEPDLSGLPAGMIDMV
ncbi:serine/threonine protein kinase, partial [Candidatus Frankia alpina]